MTQLTDLQLILLSTAAQRERGNLWPLPASADRTGVGKAVTTLKRRNLVGEREAGDAGSTSRIDGDLRYGLFITAAGLRALGIDSDETDAGRPGTPRPCPPAPARITKSGAVLALLGRDEGATRGELIHATGWLPHTLRAALTGLRRKGHAIDRTQRDGQSCYRLGVAA